MKKTFFAVLLGLLGLGFSFALALETPQAAKNDYANFKQEMQIKLQALEVKIEKLKEQTITGADEAQTKALADLEESRDKVRVELDRLETETKSDWKKLKRRIAESVDRLNRKAQEMLKK